MGYEIRNDIAFRPDNSNYETPKVSNNNRVKSSTINNAEAVNNNNKAPSVYETHKQRKSLEADLNELISQLMPERGVRFRIHDSGSIITSVIDRTSDEVIREFPAEKILDIVHSMVSKLGIMVNKKI